MGALEAAAKRAEAIAPAVHYYGPLRFLGGYHTRMPFPSGDMKASQGYFEAAMQGAPEFLATKLAWVELVLLPQGKKDQAVAALQQILAADPAVDSAVLPENSLAQERAQALLGGLD